jgi:hypothetical protein
MSKNKVASFVETWNFRFPGQEEPFAREVLYTSYNKKGDLIHSVQQWDDDANGVPESQYSRYIQYNRQGNPIEERSGYDFHSGGLGSTEITIYEYNRKGDLLVKNYIADFYEVGEFTYGYTESYTYDKKGRILSKKFEEDKDLNGVVDEEMSWFYDYNKKGKLIKEVHNSPDFDLDGSPDYTNVTEYTYDDRCKLTGSHQSFYIFGELDQNYISNTWVYDKQGRLIHHEYDDTIAMDYVLTWDYTYDKKGRLISEIHHDEFDHGPDGRLVTKYIYNKNGQLIREDAGILSMSDWDESTLQPAVLYSYDGKGRLIGKEVLASYRDVPDKLAFYQWEHDEKGRIVSELVSTDTDGVPGYDAEDLKLFAYDRKGDLVKEIHDFGNDGTYEWEYTKARVDDGAFASLDGLEDSLLLA